MAKSDTVKLNFVKTKDEETGKTQTRLTPIEVTCHRNYFYQKCFTNNGRKLLFAGEFDKNLNYYYMDLEAQTALQLTEGAGDNTFGGFLSHDEKYLYYTKGGSTLRRVELETQKEETVFQTHPDWVAYGTWVANTNTTQIVGIEIHKDDYDPLVTWDAFKVMFQKKPRCRIFTADLATGKQNIIHDEKRWLGHPIFRPFHDNTIAFCHEGPHDLVENRMWLINTDGSNMRKVREQGADESCTHEFWIPNGSGMFYVVFKATVGVKEDVRYIYKYDADKNTNEMFMTMPNCSHLMSNFDGSLLVGDGIGTPEDVVKMENFVAKNDESLYVFDTKAKTNHVAGLHKSSWKVYKDSRQITHPHPSFTPDEKQIYYTSDKEGETALYLLDC